MIKSIIKKNEILAIVFAIVILGFTISLTETLNYFFTTLGLIFIIVALNVVTKKVASYYFDSEIEMKIWHAQRFGFKPQRQLKRPFPAGIFFPILSKLILFPFKGFVWMASLVFDVKPKTYRAAKRHGIYSFSEMTEFHIGLIAAAGVLVNLIAAAIAYFANYPEFAKLSIYYTFFNMLPFSDLDGNKIFFGNLVVWSVLAIITLLGFGAIIIII